VERRRPAALIKDYLARLAYLRKGELPEQVFSARMNRSIVEPASDQWPSHLTAEKS
jgi:hypothetical protein